MEMLLNLKTGVISFDGNMKEITVEDVTRVLKEAKNFELPQEILAIFEFKSILNTTGFSGNLETISLNFLAGRVIEPSVSTTAVVDETIDKSKSVAEKITSLSFASIKIFDNTGWIPFDKLAFSTILRLFNKDSTYLQ